MPSPSTRWFVYRPGSCYHDRDREDPGLGGRARGADDGADRSLELMPFHIREVWLLDERKLNAWLDLFTDNVLYFMPRRKNVRRQLTNLNVCARCHGDGS
jgi:Ring hydroxylating beta subunit